MSKENSSGAGSSSSSSGNQEAIIDNNSWTITKTLVVEDEPELQIDKKSVKTHILAHLSDDDRAKVETPGGLKISVLDNDTHESGSFEVTLKRHTIGGTCLLTEGWGDHFVQRRSLVKGDRIGLFWSKAQNNLVFSLLRSDYDSGLVHTLTQINCKGSNALLCFKKGEALARHILDHLEKERRDYVLTGKEIQILVFDKDKSCSFNLTFVVYSKKKAFLAFTNGWRKHFVQRRNLRIGNEIGLCWNKERTALNFSVLHQ